MNCIDVHNQDEFDAAVVRGDNPCIHVVGSATVTASGTATVTAYDTATVWASDSATVRAYGSATVTAYDTATVWASDSATVWAYGSATVTASDTATVTASGSATVKAYNTATVTASKCVPVQDHGPNVTVTGGVLITIRRAQTAEEWCDFHGVDVTDGIATLYKGVDHNFVSPHGLAYTPGTIPEASDWDGGYAECGGGLHFSPRPIATLEFVDADRFVACPVQLVDIVVHPGGAYPEKVKAPRCAGPVWECDIDGQPIGEKAVA